MTKIENRMVADLIPYSRNARTHAPEQIEQLVASIRQFGFINPILVTPDGTVVAGHGRLEAAKAAGISEVPTLTVGADWSHEQLQAYVLADNQLALNAGWDHELLKAELTDLRDAGFDMGVVGFDVPTLESFFEEFEGDRVVGAATGVTSPEDGRRSLMERFGLAPFSVLSARGGWWQDRKRAWLALGIQSELGRGENLIPNGGGAALQNNGMTAGGRSSNATPGGSLMPAADYSKRQRGTGNGRAIG